MSRQAVIVANSAAFLGTKAGISQAILNRTLDRLERALTDLSLRLRFEVTRCVGLSPEEVITTVRTRAGQAQKTRDLFFFFYLGHGVLSRDLQLEFLHPAPVGHTTLPLARLEKTVAAEDVEKSLFVIDCCYAGAQDRTFTSQLSGEHCRLASTTAAARAYVVTRRTDDPVGVFARAIIDGFSSPDACRSSTENIITAESLFIYADKRTREETKDVQQPKKLGYLTEELADYKPRPDLVEGVAVSDDKTAYKKMLAICQTLATFQEPPSLKSLYHILLSRYRKAFETLYKKGKFDFDYRPVKPPVISKYVRFLRRLGLVDHDNLSLTPEGKALANRWGDRYSVHLLAAIDRYLKNIGLSRLDIEDTLRQILRTRQVPTQTTVLDSLSLRHPMLLRNEMSIILDILGYIRAIRMSSHRAYFPW